jgi:hypothetical protein
VTYQWQLCRSTGCKAIKNATTTTLKLLPAHAGQSVRLVATASIGGKILTSASKKVVVKKKGS